MRQQSRHISNEVLRTTMFAEFIVPRSEWTEEELDEEIGRLADLFRRSVTLNLGRPLRYKPSRRRGNRKAYAYFKRGLRALNSDKALAMASITVAARMGYGDAQCVLGHLFSSDVLGFEDMDLARFLLKQAADQWHPLGMVAYANMIRKESPAEAFALYRRAALRDVRAVPFLAWAYLHGVGVEKNISKALVLLSEAEKRSPKAAYMLASLINDTFPERAKTLLFQAATAGSAEANYLLASQLEFPERTIFGAKALLLGSVNMMLFYANEHYSPDDYRRQMQATPEHEPTLALFASGAWDYLVPAARMGSERARQIMAEMRKDRIPMSSTPTRIVIDPQTLRPIISVTPAFEECIEQSLMSMLEK